MPDNPTRDGYVFSGWFKDIEFTQRFVFGENGDKVTADITPYARWVTLNEIQADYAVSEIIIGYANGNNPKYVTQNLSLPLKADDVNITWSSSNADVISSAGKVTRPSGSNADVTLTARAVVGNASSTRDFTLRVIRARSRLSKDIEVLSIEEAGNGDLAISYNASGDHIVDIEGSYSKIKIDNADDALDAIYAIHDALGINNPYDEVTTFLATSDNYGSEYSFQQVYKGVKVFGRSILTSANSLGKGDFLHSNFLASNVLDSAGMKINITASDAENKAKANYSSSVSVDTAQTELVVYSLESYENKPVYAYIVKVYGAGLNDSVFINAENGAVITSYTNIHYFHFAPITAKDELDNTVSFPVVIHKDGDEEYFLMKDLGEPTVEIYDGDLDHLVTRRVGEEWNDLQQNSAYVNMREIMQWWQYSFDRNSLNDNGMTVKVVTHQKMIRDKEGRISMNNACWNGGYKSIFFDDMSDAEAPSYATAIDVVAHETTHAVVEYQIPGGLPYANETGAINEAYADIFGCLKDKDWKIGNLRDITNPAANNAPHNVQERLPYIGEPSYPLPDTNGDFGYVHTNSFIVSRAAYLMSSSYAGGNGLTWEELGKVWYKSMRMGLSMPNFGSVRRCVVNAAKKLKFSKNKIAVIEAAFDEVGIRKGTLSGRVIDASSKEILQGVRVTVRQEKANDEKLHNIFIDRQTTKEDGLYSFELEDGKYTVRFEKNGYRRNEFPVSITGTEDKRLDDILLILFSIRGVVMSSPDATPISEVNVQIFEGSDTTGTPLRSTITAANGDYSFDLKTFASGNYTLVFSKSGYQRTTLLVNLERDLDGLKTYLTGGQGISGTVYDLSNREVIEGIAVQLFEGSEGRTEMTPLKTATTNSSGGYSFSLNENGTGNYTLVFSKSGYKDATYTVSVKAGTVTLQTAELEKEQDEVPIDEEHFPDAISREYISRAIDQNSDGILSKAENKNTTMIKTTPVSSNGTVNKISTRY